MNDNDGDAKIKFLGASRRRTFQTVFYYNIRETRVLQTNRINIFSRVVVVVVGIEITTIIIIIIKYYTDRVCRGDYT